MDKKVSIIIPAYNVENYIKKCLESVLNQTYKNIEVIVIDDGSTDQTRDCIGSCNDSRFVFIEQENQGVSIARNVGMAAATGQYLVFVDGDDYLASDFVAYMVGLIETTDAEFAFSRNCFTRREEKQVDRDRIEALSAEDATACLLSPDVMVGCWNKIYSKNFLEKHKIKFSSDLFYGEGLTFILACGQKATKIGVGNRKVYYYRRNNASSATSRFDIKKYRNGERALKGIRASMTKITPHVEHMYDLHMGMFGLGAVVRVKEAHREKEYQEEYRHWKKMLRHYTGRCLLLGDVSLYRKLMLLGGCISPWLLMRLDHYRRKKISKDSVIG